MVSNKSVAEQLNKLGFQKKFWNQAEIRELPNILLTNEKIFECVDGFYENGMSLLVGTNIRILIIDKKPLKFLKVEDIRFDMINQIDYSHRFFEANITISTGIKKLQFKSYDKNRLRKLISHIQHRMAEVKYEIGQNSQFSLETLKMNKLKLENAISHHREAVEEDKKFLGNIDAIKENVSDVSYTKSAAKPQELYDEAMKAIFGEEYIQKKFHNYTAPTAISSTLDDIDMGSLKIAYAKLPMLLRDRVAARQILSRSQAIKIRT